MDGGAGRFEQGLGPRGHFAVVRFDLGADDGERADLPVGDAVGGADPAGLFGVGERHPAGGAGRAGAHVGEPAGEFVQGVPGPGGGAQRLQDGRADAVDAGRDEAVRVDGDAGQYGAGVHVDEVFLPEQVADLAEREPAEVVVPGDVLGGLDHHVPVALVQEVRAVFGLQEVDQDVGAAGPGEVLEVADGRTTVCLGVVAAGRLHGRRQLHRVDVAGLHLGLHQEVQDAAELPDQDAQGADLGLDDDRPGIARGGAVAVLGAQPLDGEEPAAAVAQVPGAGLAVPLVEGVEGDPGDLEVACAALGVPGAEVAEREVRTVLGGEGEHEALCEGGCAAAGQRAGGRQGR